MSNRNKLVRLFVLIIGGGTAAERMRGERGREEE